VLELCRGKGKRTPGSNSYLTQFLEHILGALRVIFDDLDDLLEPAWKSVSDERRVYGIKPVSAIVVAKIRTYSGVPASPQHSYIKLSLVVTMAPSCLSRANAKGTSSLLQLLTPSAMT
jgi:hypothetical protein